MDGLHAIDILVVLKLATSGGRAASVRRLEEELGLSKSAVSNSLRHLRELGLVRDATGGREVNRLLLRDCLERAARWIAPAEVGDFELGLPTAHPAEPLRDKLTGDEDPVVLPLPHGPVRGRAVSPLHRSHLRRRQRTRSCIDCSRSSMLFASGARASGT